MSDQFTELTWLDFNNAVDALCPLEFKRIFGAKNADGSSVYYRNQIRQAVIDLQRFIPAYTKRNETIYYPSDFADDGQAHVGALPPNSQFREAWFYSVDKQRRFPVIQIPWGNRFHLSTKECHDHLDSDYIVLTAASIAAIELVESAIGGPRRQHVGLMTISPKHDQFYLYPKVDGEWVFSVFWDGQKLDYRDEEKIPLDEEGAFAVSKFVQSQFASYVDKDTKTADARMADYNLKRAALYLKEKDKGLI